MRKFVLIAVLFISVCILTSKVTAAVVERYSTCDSCGLCPTINVILGTCKVVDTQIPGDWKNCVTCLYPTLYPTPPADVLTEANKCNTLKIDAETNLPINQKKVGRQFTMLGCISSGASVGFDDEQSAGGRGAPTFVQKLLDVLFSLAGGLAFLYLMYGGYIVLTSQADPERLNYGRRLIYGAIAGLIITISSVFIVNFVGSGVLKIPGFSGTIIPTPTQQ